MQIEVERLAYVLVDREGGIALNPNIAVACPYDAPGISISFDGQGCVVLSRAAALKLAHALADSAHDA